MDLNHISTQKALALEAFESGEYVEAERAWAALDSIYARYEMFDGRIALTFNRLLAAIDGAHRPRATKLMGQLASQLEQGRDSIAAFEIAERICLLFSEPMSGVDHEVTAALVAIAGDLVGQLYVEPDRSIVVDDLPPPGAFVGPSATETAIRILRLADELRAHPSCPKWLRALQRLFDWSLGPGDSFEEALDGYRASLSNEDSLRAYRSLLKAQGIASVEYLPAAFELLVGLELLEEGGLPKKLAYAPNSPEEKRYLLAADLFRRLACALGGLVSCVELVSIFNQETIRLTDKVNALISGRADKGTRRAADVERLGRSAMLRAGALREEGDSAAAIQAVLPSQSPAERGAFGNPVIAMDLFEETGRLFESVGDAPRAIQAYLALVRVAAPGFLTASSELAQAGALQSVTVSVERVLAVVNGLCGVARSDPNSDSIRYIELARFAVDVAGRHLSGDLSATAALVIELSAAQNGENGAALRALEASRVLDEPGATGLAFWYWAHEFLHDEPDVAEVEQAMSLLEDCLREVSRLDCGYFRHWVEILAISSFEAWSGEADRSRYEVHLRRALEAMGTPWARVQSERWIQYLPNGVSGVYGELVERFVSGGRASIALRMCRALLQRGRAGHMASPRNEVGKTSQALRDDYLSRWIKVETESTAGFDWRVAFERAPMAAVAEARPREWSDGFLEYFCFRDWTVMFTGSRGRVDGQKVELGRADVFSLLNDGGLQSSVTLFEQLVEPATRALQGAENVRVELPVGLEGLFTHVIAEPKLSTMGLWRPVRLEQMITDDWRDLDTSRIAILGDAATSSDLKLSTLAGEGGYDVVTTEHGVAVQGAALSRTVEGVEVVHFVGDVNDDGDLALNEAEGPISPADLAAKLSGRGVNLVTIDGPVPYGQHGPLCTALLSCVRGGVLVRHIEADFDRTFLVLFLRRACKATDAASLSRAFGLAQQDAVEAGVDIAGRSAYALYLRTS